ncbi:MAG: LysM peptidoglycan-binding domain-containing protein [Anaerolineae bacterium]
MAGRGSSGFWGTALGQALLAGGIVGVVLLTVLAGIVLTYQEQLAWRAPTPIPTSVRGATLSPTALYTPASPPPARSPSPTATPQPSPTGTPEVAIPTAPAVETPPSPPPACPPPAGWQPYVVREGDSLHVLAWQRGTTTYAVLQANCLMEATLVAGQVLYLPPLPGAPRPTATPRSLPAAPCGQPPASWRPYVVRRGDTLSDLAIRYGTTVPAILSANCLASTTIYAGQRLYLPAQPIWWPPAPTPTPRPWLPRPPTSTPALPPPGPVPTPTALPLPSPTPWVTPIPPPEPAPSVPPTPTSVPPTPPPAPTVPPPTPEG